MKRVNTGFAWVVGIVSFLVLAVVTDVAGRAVGVPLQLEFDSPIVVNHSIYDEERDSSFTAFGLAATIACGMIAARIGMAVNRGSVRGGLDTEDEIQFLAWLIGLLLYAGIGAILYLAARGFRSGFAGFVFGLLELVFALGVAWGMREWHARRLTELRTGRRGDDV